jgi:UDP-GlcNAc3NAcA epimerase
VSEAFKIVSIVGARPQFVKAAMVSRAFRSQQVLREILVHTGQHYDREMDQVFFEELQLPKPAYNLGVGSGSHATQTGEMMRRLEEILERERPRRVLVYGDTNSTLAGALTAAKLKIPVDHVEAGLRSFNRAMPEEINRIVADHLSSLLFCPTERAVANLAKEGVREGVHQVGDVMYDATLEMVEASQAAATFLDTMKLRPRTYLLLTLHRAENTERNQDLERFFSGLGKLGYPIVFPVHPRTAAFIKTHDITLPSNLQSLPPVSYFQMLQLEKNAIAILTDSGGVQKEAFFLQVPCLTLRRETEWMETVEAGWNRLVGLDPDAIEEGLQTHLNGAVGSFSNCFGDGRAAERIVEIETEVILREIIATENPGEPRETQTSEIADSDDRLDVAVQRLRP